MAGNKYIAQIKAMEHKQHRLFYLVIILTVMLVGVVGFCSWRVVTVKNQNKALITEVKQQKKYIAEIKANRVAKYSSSAINHRAEIAKKQVDGFFYAVNDWSGDNYASRYKRAKKYANAEIARKYIGGGSQKDAQEQAQNFKANKMTSKVISTAWFTEQADSNVVTGLYLMKTRTKVDGDKGTYSEQLFMITYDLTKKAVESIEPVSLD
ncbi:hypothetical protein ABC426_00495 [Lactiplantibacillus plantarum]|uniref:hypothetical protein n=1 Tax=Lactiplantibacillus plantarum TaxID=1590 RepID=UPI001BA928C2|nr:hypothetical protein [Lactiplantibacillus plantarum]MBS0953006.1 hypothetical protein [Lactiplantibacillus plantarum]